MIRYVKKHFGLVAGAVVLAVLAQVLMPVSAILEQRLVDCVIGGDIDGFLRELWYVLAVVAAYAAAYFLKAVVNNLYKTKLTRNMRNDLYESIMNKRHACFAARDTAEYISLINNDAETTAGNYSSPVWTLAGAGFAAAVSLIIMIRYSVLLTFTGVICSILSFFIPILITKHLKIKLVEKSICQADMTKQLKEAFDGHEVISAFGVFGSMKKKFEESDRRLADASYKLDMLVSILENLSVVIGRIVKFITYFIAGVLAIRGQISVGTVILFVSLYGYFNSYIMMFSQVIPLLRGCKPVADKLFELMDEKDEEFKGKECPAFSRELRVENLDFSYNDDAAVLKGLNFNIHKGEKIVLTGKSGCGKSTLIKLVGGSYHNYRGGIYYDDVELKELDNGRIKDVVTIINQNTYIFNDSIRNNICLGEQFTQDELDNALKKSGIDSFVENIAGGIDGRCGEGGSGLSGGQRQRIAIARALIRGIDFLILDEGVSAIDVSTANRIEKELLGMDGLTLLTITHRIKDGVNQCYDKVLRMENGKVTQISACD